MIISRRPVPLPLLLIIPWAHQAQSNPTAPSDLAAAIVGGSIALEWDAPTQRAASIPDTPQVGETLTADIPNVVDADGLNHAAFTCRWVSDDGTANAGIQDATGTTCSRSDEDDGRSSKARVPFPDHRDRQETLAGGPVAHPIGPRQAPQDPQVEAGYPALGVTWPRHLAGDQMPVLRYRAESHRVQSRKARGSCLETHGAYRSSAELHSCNCAYEIPQSTTARSKRVDPR